MRSSAHRPSGGDAGGLLSTLGWALVFMHSRLDRRLAHYRGWETSHAQPPITDGYVERDLSPVSLLVMDGGGIKGRNLMVMVEEIEIATGKPASAMFDLVAGTSIGGAGALFLGKYGRAGVQKSREAMTELQYRCLANRSVNRLFRAGHICHDDRQQFVIDVCGKDGQHCSGDGPHAFALAARRTRRGLEPFLLRSYPSSKLAGREMIDGTREPPLIWQAIEATSAAPLMFPRCNLGRGLQLVDGGFVTNDPTLIAIREAQALWPDRPIRLVVSLGTGDQKLDESTRESVRLGRVAEVVRRVCPGAAYFRFQPHLPKDDVSPFEEATRKDFWRARGGADGGAYELVSVLRSAGHNRHSRLVTAFAQATEPIRRARRLNRRVYASSSAF
jgi:predicted acylesterase/phospholipase RssA